MTSQSPAWSAGHALGTRASVDPRDTLRTIARIEVYENPADAWPAWSELEGVAPTSVYQTRKWLVPWIETVGVPSGVCPMIVVAHGADGAAVALFPFGIMQHGVFRVVHFLGGRDSNSNLGLIRPGVRLEQAEITSLLHGSAQRARLRPDAFVLLNQPLSWEGVANPLALLRHQPSPSECFSATLDENGAKFVDERLSAEARKKLRSKRRKLEEFGPVSHLVASDAGEAARIIDHLLAQKLRRLHEKRISNHFESPQTRQFLMRAALEGIAVGEPAIELHALAAGDRIVAVYAGASYRGRFYAMINSFDSDPAVARTSPGDLLLLSMMRMMCDRRYRVFDLGIGEARYKSSWCDRSEPLFDCLYGVTPKGCAYVLGYSAQMQLKAFLKHNKWSREIVQRWFRRSPHVRVAHP